MRCLTAILVVGLVSITSRDAAAQPSAGDAAAASALARTPVGGLIPILVSPGVKGEKAINSFSGRFAMHSPKVGDADNAIGASFLTAAGSNAAVSGTVAYLMQGCPSGATCDNAIMVGGDVHSTLWNSAAGSSSRTSVNMQGSLGYGKQGDANFLSAFVGFPIGFSVEQASKSRIGAFINPGFGWGRRSADVGTTNVSESGTRPMVGAGGSWASPAGWALHLSYNKILIENSGNSLGLGFSYNLK